jgi:hypothetical protein
VRRASKARTLIRRQKDKLRNGTDLPAADRVEAVARRGFAQFRMHDFGAAERTLRETIALYRQADVMDGIRRSLRINAKRFGIRDYAWLSILSDDPPLKNNIAPIVGTASAAAHRRRGTGIALLKSSTPMA